MTDSSSDSSTQPPPQLPAPGGPWAWVIGLVIGLLVITAISVAWTLGKSHGESNPSGQAATAHSHAPATPAATTPTAPAPAKAGDAAAGEKFFEGTCQGCHANLGHDAAVGPKLAGLGRSADQIEKTVVEGGAPTGGTMPPGLASGDDLANVVAYVESIQ